MDFGSRPQIFSWQQIFDFGPYGIDFSFIWVFQVFGSSWWVLTFSSNYRILVFSSKSWFLDFGSIHQKWKFCAYTLCILVPGLQCWALFQYWSWHTLKVLERLKCKSKGENNQKKAKVCSLACCTSGVKGVCVGASRWD